MKKELKSIDTAQMTDTQSRQAHNIEAKYATDTKLLTQRFLIIICDKCGQQIKTIKTVNT